MKRLFLALALLATLASDRALAQTDKKPAATRSSELMRLLHEPLDTKELVDPMNLKHALAHLHDLLLGKGHHVPIIADAAAFRAETPDTPDVHEAQISLVNAPRRLSLAGILKELTSQIPSGNATYLLRDGMIVITTVTRASPGFLLRAPVVAVFDKKPLDEALDELSAQTGATVLLDPRVGDKARAPITAAFKNTITLEAAVRFLAEFANLRSVVDDDILVVTLPLPAAEPVKGVRLQLRGRRLDDALRDLAQLTGTTIILDPDIQRRISSAHQPLGLPRREAAAAEDQADEPGHNYRVSVEFRGDVTAENAACILATMTGLHVSAIGNALYVAEFGGPGLGGGLGGPLPQPAK